MIEQNELTFAYFEAAPLIAPILFNSPHSGRLYTPYFLALSQLNSHEIRRSEDAYVDWLFQDVPRFGVAFMSAYFPRAFVDLNRDSYELDPALFQEPLPAFIPPPSQRALLGLGTVPAIVAQNRFIYHDKLCFHEVFSRIESYYCPYHRHLKAALTRIKKMFGFTILIDCHSMPSHPPSYGLHRQADFVLGDYYGTTCPPSLSAFVGNFLQESGYTITFNRPYPGGFITCQYGQPEQGIYALQLEINRRLYLNEWTIEPNRGFSILQKHMHDLARALIVFCLRERNNYLCAAE
ncbi:N-formylglutamate amidohydrolase [Bartonella sp. DGB2]|uniref:N-formylglutamate amidohydrolase n=1 Tax=Bartonella sp. DGB2 TaxID=3388426 RepID=UPI00398FBAD0